MDDRRAAAGQQLPLLLDAKRVLRTGIVGVEALGVDVQTAAKWIDMFHL
jgi:hypothetical protein